MKVVSGGTEGTGQRYRLQRGDWIVLLASVLLQLVIGFLLGHLYDLRIFMATGYLVATGQDPYIPQDLQAVFHNPFFQNFTTIGYPPPWPLVLGLLYRVTYAVIPIFHLYNLALKLPLIAANLGLAFLTAGVTQKLTGDSRKARKAWLFILLNPLIIYATAGWVQNDSVVALAAFGALILLAYGRHSLSAALLALAIMVKPTALPLALVPFFYLKTINWRMVGHYYFVLAATGILVGIVPFWIFHWDPNPILTHWNAHFTVGGGMSYLVFLEVLQGGYQLDGWWWSLGLLWLPGLAVSAYMMRNGIKDLPDLLAKSLAVTLVFFLTRSWLSEQNIILVLPFLLVLTLAKGLDRRILTAMWVLPLVFSVFNTGPAQLLFPTFPIVMERLLALADKFYTVRLIAKVVTVIPFQILGWWLVVRLFTQPADRLTRAESQAVPG